MSEQPAERAPRTRRTLIVGLVVLAAAVGGWIASRQLPGGPETVVDEDSGLTLTVPSGWTVAPADGPWIVGEHGGDWDAAGFVLSSGEVSELPDGWLADPDVPEDGALVSVTGGYHVGLGGSTMPGWPLDLDQDDRPPLIAGAADDLAFDHRGYGWEIIAWHGEGMDDEVGAEIDALVASIGFSSLVDPPDGTAVVDHGVLSLGPSERFPVGSVTPIEADMGDGSLDTFVVSAPGGPYGIDAHQFDGCDLAWSASQEAFSCEGRRWDIRGEPLTQNSGVILRTRDGGVDADGRLWLAYLGSGGRPIDTAGYWEDPVR